jgi:hypothetical protein
MNILVTYKLKEVSFYDVNEHFQHPELICVIKKQFKIFTLRAHWANSLA